jgi:hypothetical protein
MFRSYQQAPSTAIFAGPLGTSCSSSYRPWYALATSPGERLDLRSSNCRNSKASDDSSTWTLRPFGKCPLSPQSMFELSCPFIQLVTFHWSVARLGEKRLRMPL